MAFNGNAMCTSFKRQLLEGKHNFLTHTFKLALYDSAASLGAATTQYSSEHEVSGTGYTAGGLILTPSVPSESGVTAFVGFATATWPSATFTARGGLIYNTTTNGGVDTLDSVMVLDFGMDRAVQANDFQVLFPTTDSINAIIRIQ